MPKLLIIKLVKEIILKTETYKRMIKNRTYKIVIHVIVIVIMIFGFKYNIDTLGFVCAGMCFVMYYSETHSIKKFNLFNGSISFYDIKAAELFISSPDWITSGLDIKEIRPEQVMEYKNLKLPRRLQLTSPFNFYRKKTVDTINEYDKFINKGYYPATTLDILEASNYNILLLLLDLIKDAKCVKYISTPLKEIVPELPASEIQFLDPIEEIEKHQNENIKKFLSNYKVSINTTVNEYNIEIQNDNNSKEYISFTELLRGDLYSKGYEDLLVVKYYHSAGTFQIYEPLLLRNISGNYSEIPIRNKPSLKLKLIKFIVESKYMKPLCKIISLFTKDNVKRKL